MIQIVENPEVQIEEVAKTMIGLAMKVHRVLGPGFLESVYHNALLSEIAKTSLKAESEKRLQVYYNELIVGEFVADLVIEDNLIVELKAVQGLATAHSVQLVNYLTATRIDWGLLLNFGTSSLQYKKKSRVYHKTNLSNQPIRLS